MKGAVLLFCMGLICSIGFYHLFYKPNKPAARWRSVAFLAAVILGLPLWEVWNYLTYFGKTNIPSFIDISIFFYPLLLLLFVLLGNNRLRALISASFVFGLISLVQFPVVYLSAAVIHPVTDLNNYLEEISKYPRLYYGAVFLTSVIIAVCCLLAARWIRNTKLKPPLKLFFLFNLLFIFFTLTILAWWDDFKNVTSISFLTSFFMGVLFNIILLSLFFVYTRLTAENVSAGMKSLEDPSLLLTTQADKYAPFIPKLSKRELEVIEAVLAGNVSHKELSSSLNISVNTVKTHLKHIYQTTGVSNIAGLSSLFHGYSSIHPQITP